MAKKKLEDLSVIELEGKKNSLKLTAAGLSAAGWVGGFIYANKTGGGFWRYVGYGFLGGAITGLPAYFTVYQRMNKIDTVIKEKTGENA
jgi:hypothetical protein